ncbi:MAG: tetratricopeptide repeat protein [Marinobacter sp.]|uniref:tetratricopeptide repeat protein n=1 Tax=Marinobacter sp. TaxID=50741 RepID=UPI00299E3246|nr:tetratricopeptide repeat protein [Marinobacter sp.]MDX1755741.1 tetratricopeptide repeat protein [Marinobacter sp.]
MLQKALSLVLLIIVSPQLFADQTWQPYPDELQSFRYTEQDLAEHWQDLTDGFRGPLPTAESLRADAERWPEMYDFTQNHLKTTARSHPDLAALSDGELRSSFDAYARELRRAWALLFNGQFREARDLGLALGPAGYFPGLYAQALYATLIESDEESRRRLLKEVITLTEDIMPMAPDHPMIRFGNAYGKARILENLSASEAMGTGYTSEVIDTLEALLEDDPDNIYAVTLFGGVQSGIIEKAGSLIARMTYGAKESSMEELFKRAMQLAPDFPGVYYEYARAKLKLDEEKEALALLEKTRGMTAISAEEALLLRASNRLRESLE